MKFLGMAVSNQALRSLAISFAAVLSIAPFTGHAAVTVSVGLNFSGTSYGLFNTNSGALPPDANGAIGPNHFVEFINGAFAVYSKTNGRRVLRMTDVDFWANAGVGIDVGDGWDVSDPRIIYDAASQRWFASQVDVDTFSFILDGTLTANHFLLAVSATADPTGEWNGVLLDVDPDFGNFGDFPTLGLDGDAVYLSADLFDALGNPVGPALVSIPKTELLAASPVIDNLTRFGVMSYSDRGDVLQPAVCVDGSGHGTVLATGDLVSSSELKAFTVLNAASATATLAPATTIAVDAYAAPLDPTQPDGTTTLADNDARFSAKVYVVGGVLYAVHNIEIDNRAAIRWYRIDAANYTLLEAGTITDADLDLFFPSIAANADGTVVIGCNGSSINTFVSCYAIAGETQNGITTFGSPILLQSGATSYHGDDEELSDTGESRWGDYSATSVDPSDSSRFWTIQMYPSDINIWSTRITQLLTSPGLRLAIARAGPNVTISWPTNFITSYQLQSTSNLASAASWSDVGQNPGTNGTQAVVVLPISGQQQFFRLRKLP